MKYISIDIETTGLDWDENQVIEVGAVMEDTKTLLPLEQLPKFKCILRHPKYTGQPYALWLNSRIFKILGDAERMSNTNRAKHIDDYNIIDFYLFSDMFKAWLKTNGYKEEANGQVHIVVAGKNFGMFDFRFLEKLPKFTKTFKVSSRLIDPAMMFTDIVNDNRLPSLQQCKERAGFSDTTVSHDALEDAMDVIQLLRTHIKPQ